MLRIFLLGILHPTSNDKTTNMIMTKNIHYLLLHVFVLATSFTSVGAFLAAPPLVQHPMAKKTRDAHTGTRAGTLKHVIISSTTTNQVSIAKRVAKRKVGCRDGWGWVKKFKPTCLSRRHLLSLVQSTRRRLAALSVALLVLLTGFAGVVAPANAAGKSGGRMGGGSFSRSSSSRPSMSRSYSSPPSARPLYYRSSPHYALPRTRLYAAPSSTTILYSRQPAISPTSIVAWSIIGVLVYYGVQENLAHRSGGPSSTSALGPGISVASLTVALSVPSRKDSNSILSKLQSLSDTARTDTREGVQALVSTTCLELLRQESSIVSVDASYHHVQEYKQAEQIFNRWSIEKRSKFDRETVNKYRGKDLSTEGHAGRPAIRASGNTGNDSSSPPTFAVVTLSVAIEGDSTKFDTPMRNRSQLRSALTRLAADSQVPDCLLSAEILWSPTGTDSISEQELYADYPTLYPL